ncbi:MAG: hypothetical protein PHX51_06610 [Clostridia bacterium]|nr:hypothetical protein [Clostridia bacterium]
MTDIKIYKKLSTLLIGEKMYYLYSLSKQGNPLLYQYSIIDSEHALSPLKICEAAIDIREIKNYKEVSDVELYANPLKTVAPLIEEAVQKGYLAPL